MIDKLTAEQERMVGEAYTEGLRIGRNCDPLDRDAAADVINEFYSRTGRPAPKVLFFSSPAACLITSVAMELSQRSQLGDRIGHKIWAQLVPQLGHQAISQLGPQLGPQLESELRDRLGEQISDQIDGQLGSQLESQIWDRIGHKIWAQLELKFQTAFQFWDQLASKLGSQLESELRDQIVSQLASKLRHQPLYQTGDHIWNQIGDKVWSRLDAQFRAGFISHLLNRFGAQHWCAWETFYDACRKIGVRYATEESSLLDLWFRQARTLHWWFPFEGVAFASERHCALHIDAEGRLHHESEMAVRYPDGWGVYALNGVSVPAWLVTTKAADLKPETLTEIDNAEVRREFVRKIGHDRIVQALSPGAIDTRTYTTSDGREHPYELHRLNIRDNQWTYLKMWNPSVDLVHFEGVPNECRTVQDALNFRNGLRADQVSEDGADWYQQGDVLLFPAGASMLKPFPAIIT